MIDLHLAKQYDRDPRAFAFGDGGAQFEKKRLDIGPAHVGRDGACKDEFKGLGVARFMAIWYYKMVPC